MTPQQRHKCMSRIRSKNTRPEWLVRRFLWQNGFRYRLHVEKLAGKPDIVINRLKIAIFVNGCFWHGHKCLKKLPASNRKFWYDKISHNRNRDINNCRVLEQQGWIVIVIWECELAKPYQQETLLRLLNTLNLINNTKTNYNYPSPQAAIAAENEVQYSSYPDSNKP